MGLADKVHKKLGIWEANYFHWCGVTEPKRGLCGLNDF